MFNVYYLYSVSTELSLWGGFVLVQSDRIVHSVKFPVKSELPLWAVCYCPYTSHTDWPQRVIFQRRQVCVKWNLKAGPLNISSTCLLHTQQWAVKPWRQLHHVCIHPSVWCLQYAFLSPRRGDDWFETWRWVTFVLMWWDSLSCLVLKTGPLQIVSSCSHPVMEIRVWLSFFNQITTLSVWISYRIVPFFKLERCFLSFYPSKLLFDALFFFSFRLQIL